MRIPYTLVRPGLVLTASIALFACGDDGGPTDSDAGDEDAAVLPGHECVPYTAETVTGTIMGTWDEANDSKLHSFTVPAEPGGGMVHVSLSGAPVGPKLAVLIDGLPADIAGDLADEDETEVGVTFEAAGGQTITVRADIWRNAETYPVDHTIVWTYTGREDCYEPNDTETAAKLIPLDEELTAFFGYSRDNNYHYGELHDDWYRLEITETKDVSFELLSIPADLRINLHGYNDTDEGSIAYSALQPIGASHTMDLGTLEPGVYFVHVEVAEAGEAAIADGEPRPDHFQTPYRFRVNAE